MRAVARRDVCRDDVDTEEVQCLVIDLDGICRQLWGLHYHYVDGERTGVREQRLDVVGRA